METAFNALIDATGQPVDGAPLGALLTAQAQMRPDAPAVTIAGDSWSFGVLERAANRRARWLAEHGVQENDLVLLALPNSFTYYECAFAIFKPGATPGHVSHLLALPEIEAIIALGQPAFVVFGLPDEDMGQVLHAVVQVAENRTEVTETGLREFPFRRRACSKPPRKFDLVTEPVRDEAGKIRRTAWRECWLAKTTADRNEDKTLQESST